MGILGLNFVNLKVEIFVFFYILDFKLFFDFGSWVLFSCLFL